MTRIDLKRDELLGYSEVTVSGHSGYSDEGSDIVCAYISSASDLLMSILIDEIGVDANTSIDPEEAYVCLQIKKNDENLAKRKMISYCFNAFINQMTALSQQFPKFVSIKIVSAK